MAKKRKAKISMFSNLIGLNVPSEQFCLSNEGSKTGMWMGLRCGLWSSGTANKAVDSIRWEKGLGFLGFIFDIASDYVQETIVLRYLKAVP